MTAPTTTKPPSYAERIALPFPDQGWAVFNNHVNHAGDRALKEVARKYPPNNRHMRALLRMKRTGIMEIFKVKPTGPTKEYAVRVFAYANGITLARAQALLKCKASDEESAAHAQRVSA